MNSNDTFEQFKNNFIEQSPVSTIIYDTSGLAVYVNPAFLKLWNMPSPSLIVGIYNILKDTEVAEKGILPSVIKAFRGEVVEIPELKYVAHNDKTFQDTYGHLEKKPADEFKWIKIKMFPVYNDNHQIEYIVLTQDDITEERELQKKLISNERLNTMGILVSSIAHEFNNILGCIRGYTEILEHSLKNFPFIPRQPLERILASVENASSIIKRILNFSKKTSRFCTKINIKNFVDETASMLRQKTTAAKITVKIFISDPNLHIFFDSSELQEIFLNILTNAIDAITSAMQKQGVITITAEKRDENIVFTLEDNGTGMSEKTKERLFEPFFTTKSAIQKSTLGGTGLGMYICRKIISECKGTLSVESSEEKRFTKFTIVLPEKSPYASAVPKDDLYSQYESCKGSILIIDDDIIMNNILKELLERKKFTVSQSFSGKTGFDTLIAGKYDIALVDIFIPEMSGNEIVSELQKCKERPEIFIISGNADEIPEKTRKSAAAVFPKPVDTELLYHHCYQAMKKRGVLSQSAKN